jgi:hypothetical protein
MKLPDSLVAYMSRALLGEISSSVRAIALSLDDDGTLTIRSYLDRPPTEEDQEIFEVVVTNFSSAIGIDLHTLIARIELECQFSALPFTDLEPLDGFIYARREIYD